MNPYHSGWGDISGHFKLKLLRPVAYAISSKLASPQQQLFAFSKIRKGKNGLDARRCDGTGLWMMVPNPTAQHHSLVSQVAAPSLECAHQ
ncbi:hypothetical protein NM208_g8489 [Fusarium decemcellulare]|uniref:Uncharacterized protein n=1 Tax=Fusarium decemcellulare TaxID=57161 RepID=A0ACC1S579_9HYPO|nr:hypothetical protein NM208_g8489 [Fusarium decemcellulare]